MKQKKKSKSSASLLARYNAMETKGNLANSGIKTLVDVVIGATLGAGLGAATGRLSIPIGVALIIGGNYFDKDTGVLPIAGAATIAYGIGKAIENKKLADANSINGFTLAGETSKAKERLLAFKDEILAAFYLDKVFKKKEQPKPDESSQTVGAIDISALDVYDLNNHNAAVQYEIDQGADHLSGDPFTDSVAPEFSYSIEEEPDMTYM